MKDIEVWKFLGRELEINKRAMLLVVVDSKGSSPGRAGFKMGVSVNGKQFGTIGGGNVEHALFQEALDRMKKNHNEPKIKKQIHQEGEGEDISGMLCSGEQTVLFYPIEEKNAELIEEIIASLNLFDRKQVVFTPDDFVIKNEPLKNKLYEFVFEGERKWVYSENLFKLLDVTIFGAGHVCLALSETLSKLGFYIRIVDDREDFIIMNNNIYAHEKIVMNYDEVGEKIAGGPEDYFIIMTHSHKGDSKVLQSLINKEYKYLGMLGSPPKVKEVFDQLEKRGVAKEKLRKVFAPIGLSIKSKTVEEIAVSIAAEMIKEKNK